MKICRLTNALEDHVHRHRQVNELYGLSKHYRERGDCGEVYVGSEWAKRSLEAWPATEGSLTHLKVPATDDMITMAHFSW